MNILDLIIVFLLAILGHNGVYFSDFDYMVCTTESSCVHEEGHYLDDRLGFPSQTDEFKEVINEKWPILLEDNSCYVQTDVCKYSEAYANLWGAVKGNIDDIPEDLREFYGL